jgi:hypothetical protein
MTEPIQLTPLSADRDRHEVVLQLQDAKGQHYEARMPSMACMSMIGALMVALEGAAKHPAPSQQSLAFQRMQLAEIGETLFVRLFVDPETFHEYSVPANTTLAQALLEALEARNLRKTTHPGSNIAN